jgi:thymidylate synthase (FAD)
MKIINASFIIETKINSQEILKSIERFGRTAYKSEDLISDESSEAFVSLIIKNGHLSVIEHISITVRITCDRGISHEIVRHRLASYTQESTRYCNYSKGKFGNEITVIKPCFWDLNNEDDVRKFEIWKKTMDDIEIGYLNLIELGASPQEARSILPNSLKTEIVVTMNLREWRHFFEMRTSEAAHPQMREIALPLLNEFKEKIPIIFDNIG